MVLTVRPGTRWRCRATKGAGGEVLGVVVGLGDFDGPGRVVVTVGLGVGLVGLGLGENVGFGVGDCVGPGPPPWHCFGPLLRATITWW